MSDTQADWGTCGWLANHNLWHWALYHVERGDFDTALGMFDEKVLYA